MEESAIPHAKLLRRLPSAPLSRFVAEIFAVEREPSQTEVVGLPQGFADVVLRVFSGRSPLSRTSDVHVVGTQKRAWRVSVEDTPVSVVVRFRPGGALPFFRVPMRELSDEVFPIEDFWGREGRELHERLIEEPKVARWLSLIEEFLEDRTHRIGAFEPLATTAVSRAARQIARTPVGTSISTVAAEIGVSQRQLRRHFDEAVGISPKAFAQILRFRRAIHAADSAWPPNWADIAISAGYYDQAHFIGDCQSFTGMTPTAFLQVYRRANRPTTEVVGTQHSSMTDLEVPISRT